MRETLGIRKNDSEKLSSEPGYATPAREQVTRKAQTSAKHDHPRQEQKKNGRCLYVRKRDRDARQTTPYCMCRHQNTHVLDWSRAGRSLGWSSSSARVRKHWHASGDGEKEPGSGRRTSPRKRLEQKRRPSLNSEPKRTGCHRPRLSSFFSNQDQRCVRICQCPQYPSRIMTAPFASRRGEIPAKVRATALKVTSLQAIGDSTSPGGKAAEGGPQETLARKARPPPRPANA